MSFDRVDEVKGLRDMCDSLLVRAEAAEKERDEWRQAASGRTVSCSQCDRANADWHRIRDLHADALTEVARLRERYDEAVAHLHGIVEADKQDAQMGNPNPGDSCVSIYISLVLMEWLDTRASLAETGDPRNRDANPHPDAEDDA